MNNSRYHHFIAVLLTVTFVNGTTHAKSETVGDLFTKAQQNKSLAGSEADAYKSGVNLPGSNLGFKEKKSTVNLDAVKPPKSTEVMKRNFGGDNKAEYEGILNQQIQQLYGLTQKFKGSKNRGEMWLRLAELYVEKAGLIDGRRQDEYDAKLRDFQSGKIKKMPFLNTEEAKEYNRKAVQLYEWFQRDFPRDEKIPQALFFLGYNYFELGEPAKAAKFYEELTSRFPDSPFVGEAHFALAEYNFENDKWATAYKEYSYLIKDKSHRLNTFALYKGAWCLFRLDRVKQGMNYLEYIIKSGKVETGEKIAGQKTVNRTRLESEALRDIVAFYAEAGEPDKAPTYFNELVGQNSHSYIERLAYQYSDRGNKEASRDVFKILIAQDPNSAKAFEYQYQIVQNLYYAKNTSHFKDELYKWVTSYDVKSDWYAHNAKNLVLVENSKKLRETTLRNYVLQQHQTAQNSRAPFSQSQAYEGYLLYLKEFADSTFAPDMHFYFGELLYDMQKYDEAGIQYKWVVDHAPTNKFYEQSAQNLILAVERGVPSDQEMLKKSGNSLDPVALEPKVDRLVKMSKWYIEKFPHSTKSVELTFRLGRIYYQANQFSEAVTYFNQVIKESPKSKYAEYSANLLLDIHNLKKDYAGLEKTASDLLQIPVIASSKLGGEIREILEKTSFKKSQDLEAQGKYSESAKEYGAFAKKNPLSNLAAAALFNAAINYERAGMPSSAVNSYQAVIKSKDPTAQKFRAKSLRLMAKQYQDTANFEEAARYYMKAAQEIQPDPLAANLYFNAAVLFEALGKSESAIQAYHEFSKLNKKTSENLETAFNVAQIQRKAGHNSAAISGYLQYVEGGGRNPEKVVESAYWVSELYRKQHSITKADEWAHKTIAIQKRLSAGHKTVGVSFAAKMKLANALETYKELKKITFPRDPAKQKTAANKKVNLLTALTGELADVIKLDSGDEIVSSLVVLGDANLNMAQSIITAPLPPGLNAEESKQYKAGVEKFAEPFTAKAKDSFKLAVQRSWDLEIYNDAYHTAFEYMNKVDPKTYYNGGELYSDVRQVKWLLNDPTN